MHTYRLNGNQIVAEEWTTTGTNGAAVSHVLVYLYDAEGTPVGMQYRNQTYAAEVFDVYWYEKNLQGDIVAVYDNDGVKLISYNYDAWGNFTTAYHNGSNSTSAIYNPFLYRGYYYDAELGMYYLQSRYYDPVICRFINPDTYLSTGQNIIGNNMYAYCINNPVLFSDLSGDFCGMIAGAILGAVGGFTKSMLSGKSVSEALAEAGKDALEGAVWGLIGDIAVATGGVGGLVIAGVAAAASTTLDYVYEETDNGSYLNWSKICENPGQYVTDVIVNTGITLLTYGMADSQSVRKAVKPAVEFGKRMVSSVIGETSKKIGNKVVQYGAKRIFKQTITNITGEVIQATIFDGMGELLSLTFGQYFG